MNKTVQTLCPLCRLSIAITSRGILRLHHNRQDKPCLASGTNAFHPEEARERVYQQSQQKEQSK